MFQTVPRNIIIKLDFCGKNLSSSQVIALESSETKVQWEYFYDLSDISENLMKDFAANPFVCKLTWLEYIQIFIIPTVIFANINVMSNLSNGHY